MNDIFQKFGMEVPIFGFSHCRDVVVAISKAGGMGVYGAGLHDDETIAMDIRWIVPGLSNRALTLRFFSRIAARRAAVPSTYL